jgi:YHS domain-containing protein
MNDRNPVPRYFAPVGLAALIALAGCESSNPRSSAPGKSEAPLEAPSVASREVAPADLTIVTDASQVCMVNDQFMGRPQIPVQVQGKTYYGCCAMCKTRLQSDAASRTAIDPVSHTPVDKASAVIGKTANGSTLYFASREHFDSYARRAHAR